MSKPKFSALAAYKQMAQDIADAQKNIRDAEAETKAKELEVAESAKQEKEGNAFTMALKAAREKGDATFKVGDKEYKTENFKKIKVDEGLDDDDKDTLMKVAKKLKKASATHDKQSKSIMKDLEDDAKKEEMDPVNPKAAAKKFKDRKDKDIDNDGDVDSSDEYLHKRRKAIGKAMKKEDTDIRGKLMSIWEDAAGTKRKAGATDPEPVSRDDERSGKKMRDGHGEPEKHGGEESKKAEDSTKKAPMRSNDKPIGDRAIINQIANAYKTMQVDKPGGDT